MASGTTSRRRQMLATVVGVRVVDPEAVADGRGALVEQVHAVGRRRAAARELVLGADPQRLAAGRQRPSRRARRRASRQQHVGGEQVLEVVEHEQQRPVGEIALQRLERRSAR